MTALRTLLTIVLVLVLAAAPAAARAVESAAVPERATDHARASALYDEAVALYRRAEYGAAATRFEAVLDAGGAALPDAARARALRARGNCAFRAGDPLTAVGWYTAALRLTPRDRALRSDAELARSDAGLPPSDRGDFVGWLRASVLDRRADEARALALVGAGVLALVLLVELVVGGRVLRVLAGVAALGALLAALPWLATLRPEPAAPQLVLRASAVPVRAEPRGELAPIEHLDPGAVVARLDALSDWVRVELPGGERGWVPAGALFALER